MSSNPIRPYSWVMHFLSFFSLVSLLVAVAYVRAEAKFCHRDGWRENYVDDLRLAYKALTGSPDWVN